MRICGTFRLTFETRDFKYIIGTVPQESGRVVTLDLPVAIHSQSHQTPFQDCWSVSHTQTTRFHPDHIRCQF